MGSMGFIEWIIVLVFLALSIVALIDILKSNFKESINKIAWVLIVILLPMVGTILYFAIGKNQKK